MPYLFLAAFAFVLFILLLQKLEHAETKLLVQTIKWTFIGVMILAGVYLILVGRLFHVAIIVALITLLLKTEAHSWVTCKSPTLPLPRSLTKKAAAALLQVGLNASPEEIKEAYKDAVKRDSTQEDRLTQARDILLKKKKGK